MAGIKKWNCTSLDPVCWVCGKCRARCDRDFGKGLSPILSHWTWYGQVLRSILPKYRPPDYALHGVTRVTHSGLDGCWRALVQHHGFTKRRAVAWVQTHVNPCRVASHSVAPQNIAGQGGEKPSLRCEQSIAILFVSTKAWGPLIVDLNNEGLLQHVVEGGHTWAQNFDWWWDCLHKSATIAETEGLLGAQEMDTLKMCYRKWQCITKGANWCKPCGCTFGLTTCLGLLSSGMPLVPLLPSRQKKGTRL